MLLILCVLVLMLLGDWHRLRFQTQLPLLPRPRVIIHIGPHKTRSTSLQKELVQGKQWLREHGVSLAIDSAKSGANLANILLKESKGAFNNVYMDDVKAHAALDVMTKSQLSLYSAEDLDRLSSEGWSLLLTHLKDHDVTVFICQRPMTAWLRSIWYQEQHDFNHRQHFWPWLSKFSKMVEPMAILDRLDKLPVRVVGVSLETLDERNVTPGSFLVCNVTIRNHDLESCMSGWQSLQKNAQHANEGFAVELELGLYIYDQVQARCGFKLETESLQLLKSLRNTLHLPTYDISLDSIPYVQFATQEWYQRTGAERPVHPQTSHISIFDYPAMTPEQLESVVAAVCNHSSVTQNQP